jgi:hypothetical protein
VLLAAAVLAAPADAELYWAFTGTSGGYVGIGRSELDGSHVELGFLPVPAPSSLAVSRDHIYYTTDGFGVARADLDGSHAEMIDQDFASAGIAVDSAHIYFASGASIGRANLDGSNSDRSFIPDVRNACGVAVDGGHVYWGEVDGNAVGRANLDGTGVNHTFIPADFGPCGVAVDSAHVYWANYWDDGTSIGRANLDGTGVQKNFITGATSPCGVAVDGGHVYWANRHAGTIGRANLDGSAANQQFITADIPCGVAVDALAGSDTTLTAPSIIYGQPLALDAVVSARSGAAATGNVAFEINGEPAADAVPLSGGHAHLSPSYLLDVGDIVQAFFAGDAGHAPSHSALVAPVRPARTSMVLSVAPARPVAGGDLTITARVSNLDTTVVPFGTVTFSFAPPVDLDENGDAVIEIDGGVPAGNYHIAAAYFDHTGAQPDFVGSQAQLDGTVAPAATPSPTLQPTPSTTPPTKQTITPTAAKPVSRTDLATLAGAWSSALRKRGLGAGAGHAQHVGASAPGTLTVRIASKRSGRARATVLASGRHVFAAPGSGTLKLGLTAAGKRAARAHRPLRIAVSVSFAPKSGMPVSVSKSLKVPR